MYDLQTLKQMIPAAGQEVIHVQDLEFVDGKQIVFENVRCHYACLLRPNTTYKPEWSVCVEIPEAHLQSYLQYGFRIKIEESVPAPIIRCKKYTVTNAGEPMDPPAVVDADKVPWTAERGLIGNGSICNVVVKAMYTEDTNGVKAITCYLNAVQIVDHVPYTGGAVSVFSKVQGNTAGFVPGATAQPVAQAPAAPAPLGVPAPPAYQPAQVPVPPAYQPAPQQQMPAQTAPVPEVDVNAAVQQALTPEIQNVEAAPINTGDIPF